MCCPTAFIGFCTCVHQNKWQWNSKSTFGVNDGNKDRDSTTADDDVSKTWNLAKKMKHDNESNLCNATSIDDKGFNDS